MLWAAPQIVPLSWVIFEVVHLAPRGTVVEGEPMGPRYDCSASHGLVEAKNLPLRVIFDKDRLPRPRPPFRSGQQTLPLEAGLRLDSRPLQDTACDIDGACQLLRNLNL